MPVYQTNLWVCEICGNIAATTQEVMPGSDPVVSIPKDNDWDNINKDWEYITQDGIERLACFNCQKEYEENLPNNS